jgi:uncharacterized protein YggL (DUF469 family)
VLPSIFRIDNGNLQVGFGTGFLITDDLVITCAHVCLGVEVADSLSLCYEDDEVKGTLIQKDEEFDIALIKIPPNKKYEEAMFTTRIGHNDDVRILGYNSRDNKKPIDQIGKIQDNDSNQQRRIVWTGTKIIDGYSGGPLLNDKNGYVIGMVDRSQSSYLAEGGFAIHHALIKERCAISQIDIKYAPSARIISSSEKVSEIEERVANISFFPRQLSLQGNSVDFDTFLDRIEVKSKKLIYGIGGLGKSILLNKAFLFLTEKDPLAFHVYFDVKEWDNNYGSALLTGNTEEKLETLCLGFNLRIQINELKSKDKNVYVYLDGINEFPDSGVRNAALDVIDRLSLYSNVTVLATSRHLDRELKNWEGHEVSKVDIAFVQSTMKKHFGRNDYDFKTLEYLTIPFFLDIVIRTNDDKITTYSNFIYEHTLNTLSPVEQSEVLEMLSDLTFKNYLEERVFKFRLDTIDEHSIAKKILKLKENYYEFEHHLIYEFFVSHKMSRDESTWNHDVFDKMTFDNKMSFELMQMTLEQISEQEKSEKFLLSLYDWSFYATLHCLYYVDSTYPVQFAKALIIVLSEKLFDRFVHTRKKAIKYLERLFKKFKINGISFSLEEEDIASMSNEQARKYFSEIINSNSDSFQSGNYKEWFGFFSKAETVIEESVLQKITSKHSLWGWSAASFVRRFKYSPTNESQLRAMLFSVENRITKWRIAHSMGTCSQDPSIHLLKDQLREPQYKWVKYGIIRSLTEIALFELNNGDFETLLEELFIIFNGNPFESIVSDEFRSCLTTRVDSIKHPFLIQKFESKISSCENDEKTKWTETYEQFKKHNGIR